jgi:predicted Kef-type K+ transport protein
VNTGHPHESPPASLWFALLGAPTAWGLQLLIGWLIADFACQSHGAITKLSNATLRLVIGAVSLVAMAFALGALAIGVRAWRRSHDARLSSVHAFERPDFMAAVALFVSASFTLGILWGAFGPLLLQGCELVR